MSASIGSDCRGFVAISVDDGHPTDLKTAELLHKYGLKATFYVPAKNPEREVMPPAALRELSGTFELGGHTLNHVSLLSLPPKQAWTEIVDGKNWLEDITGTPATSFCYPKGKFDRSVAGLVRKAGFKGARTCLFNLYDFPENPFFWGVSTQAYSHSPAVQLRHALLERNLVGVWNYWKINKGSRPWRQHFLHALDHVVEHGGIAHLYMHSWETDQLQQWNLLESVFASIADRPSLSRVTNGELFELWSTKKGNHGTNLGETR